MAAQPLQHNDRVDGRLKLPGFVPIFNPIARRLVSAGLLGPNILLTVTGRKSGLPRSTPVALVELDGRRWIIGTFGAVGWVKNLRAAPLASITVKGRTESIQAKELSPSEGATFFREVLGPYVSRSRIRTALLSVLGGADILKDPVGAAQRRPVFALTPADRPESVG